MSKADYIVEGATGPFEIVVGLEVHAQVLSESKLFSSAATAFGAPPNSQVSLVDAAMPGMLPVINEVCVKQAIRTGLGIHAQINRWSRFDRKNYFYPDLPQGYQISQLYHPIVGEGYVDITLEDGSSKRIGVERIHLEQDAGKSVHDLDPRNSHVDLNRSGIALMEIVSRPDMRSPHEAGAYLAKLRSIVRYLGTCDGNMDQGSMRADVNVSVRRPGEPFGTRCEIKNVNSVKFVQQAIVYEAARQVDVLENGGEIVQETRLFDPVTGETRSMRSKEDAHDYRYFPDPDLPPLVFSEELVEAIRASMPELPDQKRARFVQELGLSEYDASVLCADKMFADYFEDVIKTAPAKMAANWITGELFGALNKAEKNIDESPVSAQQLADLILLIEEGLISGKIAKTVFDVMWTKGGDPREIVETQGLAQVSDTAALEGIIDGLIAQAPENVEAYKAGKVKIMGWFVGQVMKQTEGKANPSIVNEILKTKLDQQ
ncbi:MAG: Asp-tRNA(Asn)/Glu-tRNA(Gln) amidotransferase GatCAB subunit B [Alphaproteobacteria bacterium]|nr:Asp-tRNA(Asn)/Glu-tRNA(Gln) amidotransferase GatCAB subunit B [Alphaproteobacteria bacterium]